MYIYNASLYQDLIKSKISVPISPVTSEKYENCENFYKDFVLKHNNNRRKLFHSKKI